MHFITVAVMATTILLTSGCSKSLDDRFDDLCARMDKEEPAGAPTGACDHREFLTDDQKLQLIESFEAYWAAKEDYNDLVEYGKNRGLTAD